MIVMKRVSKIPGLLLILALIAAALPAGSLEAAAAVAMADPASAPSAALDQRPADCPAHGGKSIPYSPLAHSPRTHSPLPAPVSYQCCLTGHDTPAVPISK